MTLSSPLTLGPVAQRFGCPVWQIRRLFERGLLPPAARIGAYRVVAFEQLPEIEQALRAAGYLQDEQAMSAEPEPVVQCTPNEL